MEGQENHWEELPTFSVSGGTSQFPRALWFQIQLQPNIPTAEFRKTPFGKKAEMFLFLFSPNRVGQSDPFKMREEMDYLAENNRVVCAYKLVGLDK